MEIIYLDQPVPAEEIRQVLQSLFPALLLFEWDFISDEPSGYDNENSKHIFFNTDLDPDKIEFGFTISIYGTPEENSQERQELISRAFSEKLNQRTIIGFQHPDEPNSPYYSLIFEKGKTFLADDFDTNFADGSENLVKVLGEYDLPECASDSFGAKINP